MSTREDGPTINGVAGEVLLAVMEGVHLGMHNEVVLLCTVVQAIRGIINPSWETIVTRGGHRLVGAYNDGADLSRGVLAAEGVGHCLTHPEQVPGNVLGDDHIESCLR